MTWDKNWRPSSPQSVELLIGLIDEADRLQRYFGARLKVVVFLRTCFTISKNMIS